MTVRILAHRGFEPNDNSISGLMNGLREGFGIETDIRDLDGEIVISHDAPTKFNQLLYLDDFLKAYNDENHLLPLAFNIKSDGLATLLIEKISKFALKDYFVFDMSVPDQFKYLNKTKVFSRISEFEKNFELLKLSQGCWLDEIGSPWLTVKDFEFIVKLQKPIAIVSREIHGWDHLDLWEIIRRVLDKYQYGQDILLCTDLPDEARVYFNE
jgi:hypothetical protein